MLCAKFGWKCPSASGEEDFKKFSIMYFLLFCNYMYLHFEMGVIFHWKKNLNHLHPRMLCAKFGLKWPSGSGEQDF